MQFVGWNVRKIIIETYLFNDIPSKILDPRGLTTEVFIESTTDYNVVYPPRNDDRNLSYLLANVCTVLNFPYYDGHTIPCR